MFDKIKALMDMQKKMQEVKHELENTNFEIKSSDGLVRIVMSGSQDIRNVEISGNLAEIEKQGLENSIKEAFSRANKRCQEIATQKMKNIVGLNLPGT
jgi:DNA-binding YbaB/EbfC family protein